MKIIERPAPPRAEKERDSMEKKKAAETKALLVISSICTSAEAPAQITRGLVYQQPSTNHTER